MLPQQIIAAKRDGRVLTPEQIDAFARGLADGTWSDAQAAALAMAIVCRGMGPAETAALTRAMTHSGDILGWQGRGLNGPVLDKHSTGGVGDKLSLMVAPWVAACGGIVPMISGRGLAHTGGTLDKLESLPGLSVNLDEARVLDTLKRAGCAIVGASARLAPADRRLYAVRDITATVESLPLITASILSKKLAAGLQGLVLDVKAGNGAFMPDTESARDLALSLVRVAADCGLASVAWVTDMDQPLGRVAGNALELREALDFLAGREADSPDPRQRELTLELVAEMLVLGGLAPNLADARVDALKALDSGEAAERFARMVRAQGGPADVFAQTGLAKAPVCLPVPAAEDGCCAGVDTRALGWAVVELGGGRRQAGDRIDPAVGLSALVAPGEPVARGQPLAWVHAADEAAAQRAVAAVQTAYRLAPGPCPRARPVLRLRVDTTGAGTVPARGAGDT